MTRTLPSARTLLLAERSPRLVELARWLELLATAGSPRATSRVLVLDDLGELFEPEWRGVAETVLIVDAEALRQEEIGLLRRWLAREDGASLCLVGEDGVRAMAKRLLRSAGAEDDSTWLAWPPDVPTLEALLSAAPLETSRSAGSAMHRATKRTGDLGLVGADEDDDDGDGGYVDDLDEPDRDEPRAAAPRETARASVDDRRAPPARAAASESELEELREIEFILGRPRPEGEKVARADSAAPVRQPRASRTAAALVDGGRARRGSVETPRDASPVEPPWFREQVADLADVAQRIELSLSAARSADFEQALGAAPGQIGERKLTSRLDELEGEVLRLSQFARTLGYLAAPPARGSQTFELGALVTEWVRGQAEHYDGSAAGEAPRFLLRADEALRVRSDKALLTQAFDAFFYVARRSTGPGEPIRVQTRRAENGGSLVSIEFGSGPLAGRSPEEIRRPYALRRVLPELGANALAAATAIVRGQGGEVELREVPNTSGDEGRMEWRVSLPPA